MIEDKLDLDYHIRHEALPKPGGMEELRTLIAGFPISLGGSCPSECAGLPVLISEFWYNAHAHLAQWEKAIAWCQKSAASNPAMFVPYFELSGQRLARRIVEGLRKTGLPES